MKDSFVYEEPEELGEFITLPKGEYPFEVAEVQGWQDTKKGDEMLGLILNVEGPKGENARVYANLVFIESMRWKINGFLKSIFPNLKAGKTVDWEDTSWLTGRKGRLKLTDPKPVPGKDYLRNEVDRYLYEKSEAAKKPDPEPDPEEEDDDIPF